MIFWFNLFAAFCHKAASLESHATCVRNPGSQSSGESRRYTISRFLENVGCIIKSGIHCAISIRDIIRGPQCVFSRGQYRSLVPTNPMTFDTTLQLMPLPPRPNEAKVCISGYVRIQCDYSQPSPEPHRLCRLSQCFLRQQNFVHVAERTHASVPCLSSLRREEVAIACLYDYCKNDKTPPPPFRETAVKHACSTAQPEASSIKLVHLLEAAADHLQSHVGPNMGAHVVVVTDNLCNDFVIPEVSPSFV